MNTNPNEHIEYVYPVYNDFEDLVRQEGVDNVLHDLEHIYPELYSLLMRAFIRASLVPKMKLPALLDKNAPEL